MFAVEAASAPAVVGASVAPNADTMRLMPAAAYSDLSEDRSESDICAHSRAWSAAPLISKNERALRAHQHSRS